MEEEVPLGSARSVVVVTDAMGRVRDLAFEYARADGVHASVAMPLTLQGRDPGTRVLTQFRVHGIEVRALRR